MGLTWLEKAGMKVVRQGRVPRHVAIIMDGNRRYARQRDMPSYAGHHDGGDKLLECMEWCYTLGVEVLSVYAFSIENFKRSEAEVEAIMSLAKRKLDEMCENRELLEKFDLVVRVLGDLSLLPPALQKTVARVVSLTQHHRGPVLNICFAYTGRYDMCHAVRQTVADVAKGAVEEGNVCEDVLQDRLLTGRDPPVSLLLRTSGETRLSDFLLWQTQSDETVLEFTDVLWPQLSVWLFLAIILKWQVQVARLPPPRHVAAAPATAAAQANTTATVAAS